MSKSVSIRGHITNQGKLNIFNKEVLTRWLTDNKEKNVVVEITVRNKKRTNPLNRWYWGVIVRLVRVELNEYGNEFDSEETHSFLKQLFNYKEVEIDDQIIKVPVSTTKLDNAGFIEYCEKIIAWAAMDLNIQIPFPNEDVLANY